MLTPTQIDNLRTLTNNAVQHLTDWILKDICRRIAEAGTITSSAEYQIWRLKKLGMRKRQLYKEIKKRLGVTKKELDDAIKESAKTGYQMDVKRLNAEQAVPFEKNAEMLQILDAAQKQAGQNFDNITQTIGFVMPNGSAVNLTQAYIQACDFAHLQVANGVTDVNTAVKNATRNLVNQGVQTIDYASGQHVSVEAAVRRSVMGGVGIMQEQISKQNHDELGADGWEISAHAMSAPDHEPIQGHQYTDAQYQALEAHLKRHIGTLNCKHIAFPIIYGISEPTYTQEQLNKFIEDNAKGITYNGKHYTLYEATQKQRGIERAIRTQKRRVIAAESAASVTGDNSDLQAEKGKLTRLNQEYNRFSRAAGLTPQYDRTDIGRNV